jgi:hypothetical protein
VGRIPVDGFTPNLTKSILGHSKQSLQISSNPVGRLGVYRVHTHTPTHTHTSSFIDTDN